MSKQDLMEEDVCWDLWIRNRDPEAGDILVRKVYSACHAIMCNGSARDCPVMFPETTL